ncbi:MAG: AI-2E family transporter [Chloroflexi bacterium]|nr:AI-2E family transporter [Chloroflexota bacterium]
MDGNTPEAKLNKSDQPSPNWAWTTKLVVGLALVAIFLLLIVRFQTFLGPLITAILIAYLINPLANFATKKLKLPWRISVTVIYLLLVLVILGLMTWGGFALVEQVQNLISFIESNIHLLPDLVAEVTERTYEIGPFKFSPTGINWDDLTNELVSAIQPAIGRLGTLVGSVAAGALGIITGTILVVLISYFLLAESPGFSGQEFNPRQTSYTQDLQRINTELNRIWSAFIRSELLVVLISYVLYTISLGVMGVQFFVGLAAIAAFGQLIPYVGAWVTWISFGLVALFQTNTPFGLPAGIYTIIVLAVSMVINGIIDNIIRTKVMSSGLKVHPALVLISAIISVQLFGFIGIVIAAPIVASFKLFLIYAIKKLNDQNPFEGLEVQETVEKSKWALWLESFWQKLKTWIINLWRRLWKRPVQKAQRVESTQPDTVAEEGRD